MSECTHSWETCPVHGTGTEELPDFPTVIACVYGDCETKDGRPVDIEVGREIWDRVLKRLGE